MSACGRYVVDQLLDSIVSLSHCHSLAANHSLPHFEADRDVLLANRRLPLPCLLAEQSLHQGQREMHGVS